MPFIWILTQRPRRAVIQSWIGKWLVAHTITSLWLPCLTLRWRNYGRDGVSNHQSHDCLLNSLFRRRSKKTSKLRVTGLCAGNSPGTGEFPAQMTSNAEIVSIWWRHHGHHARNNNYSKNYLMVNRFNWVRIRRSFEKNYLTFYTVNSPHKWPVTRKNFPFDDVIMMSSQHKSWRRLTDNAICMAGQSQPWFRLSASFTCREIMTKIVNVKMYLFHENNSAHPLNVG